jgi:hypothetical protein
MKIGLLVSTVKSIAGREDDADISPGDRGRRFINSLLYRACKPQEISLALAIFGLLNGGSLFFFSHDKTRIKLEPVLACYANSPATLTSMAETNCDDSEFVSIEIPMSKLKRSASVEGTGNHSLDNEVDQCMDLCAMHDYWYRPALLDEFSYMETVESYYLKSGKGPRGSGMLLGHPMPEKRHWARYAFEKTACGIVYGKGLPNIYGDAETNTPNNREYYFKALLVLFKPHRKAEELLRHRK